MKHIYEIDHEVMTKMAHSELVNEQKVIDHV